MIKDNDSCFQIRVTFSILLQSIISLRIGPFSPITWSSTCRPVGFFFIWHHLKLLKLFPHVFFNFNFVFSYIPFTLTGSMRLVSAALLQFSPNTSLTLSTRSRGTRSWIEYCFPAKKIIHTFVIRNCNVIEGFAQQ